MSAPKDYLDLKLQVIAYQEGDPAHHVTIKGQEFTKRTGETSRLVKNPGYSIRQLRESFGGLT